MSRPSKPISKNSNSKYTPRNNKQDIFSKFANLSKPKAELNTPAKDESEDKTN